MSIEAARRVLRNLRDPERGSDQISRDCDEAAETIEALLSMAEGRGSSGAVAPPRPSTAETMVEHVARAIAPNDWAAKDTPYDPQYRRDRRVASLRKARAAIEAVPAVAPILSSDVPRRLGDIEDRLRLIAEKGMTTATQYLLLGDANYLTDLRLSFDALAGKDDAGEKAGLTQAGEASEPPDDAREAAHEIISDLLSMCDASNWDADGYRDLEYSIRHEVYERLHDFAADWQQRIGALRAVERPDDPRGWREAVQQLMDAEEAVADVEEFDLEPTPAKRHKAMKKQEAAWKRLRKLMALSPAPKDREGG